ncbi:outer membrane protein [Erythrobacter litoralis]|uniref:Membrane protein n=1 Tax=Erythrobacter litoralis TaxID=39960 RepID=A0A074MLA4_9SPHN|nr:outer membrane beta-barrel protein [Erythrobacter litoralis]AOL23226.1 outer membrane protein [Erythrobacter litoralis]KEO92628.1 membrane protein [Erythrobacter litoralis]
MKKLTLFLLAGSAFAVSSPAMAQDEGDFTGFRLEALAGFDASKAGSSVDDDIDDDNDQSIEGLIYGAGAGYDMDFGGVVVGVEAELTDSTADTGFEDGDFEGIGLGNVETGRDIYVGARAGFVASPGLLVYAKGGYTNARYNIESTFDGEDYDEKIDADGYRVGAGAEYRFGTNTFAKIEYRYSNYSEAELDFEDDTIPDVDLGEIDLDRHQVMAGVGFRF